MALSSSQSLYNMGSAAVGGASVNATNSVISKATAASEKERLHEGTKEATDLANATMAEQAARGEAGRALSDFTTKEDYKNSIQQSANHSLKSAADLIKSAAN